MKLLTTSNIDLESRFNSDQIVPFKYFSKGRVKVKSVPINSIDKSYIYDCSLILDTILHHQQLLHDFDRYINISKKGLNKVLGDKRRLCAIHILEHGLGIIDVNHKYSFKNGSVSNYSKSYCIAPQYKGEHMYITLEQTRRINNKGGAHVHTLHSKAINKDKGGSTCTNNTLSKNDHVGKPIMHPLFTWEKVNDTTGRVFNHINMMKKVDRKNLKDEHGNPLIEVDFCCSHLQHLIKLFSDDLKNGSYVPIQSDAFIQEVTTFKQQLLNNDLYQMLSMEYQEKAITRDNMKVNVMYWLTGCYLKRKVVKWLCKKHPLITHYIAYNNSNYSTGVKTITRKNFIKRVPKKNGMAIRLMKSESHLVNDLIRVHIPTDKICHTVFDGFLLEQDYLNKLLHTIDEHGKEYFGFDPKYKVNMNDSTIIDMCDMPTNISEEVFETYYEKLPVGIE